MRKSNKRARMAADEQIPYTRAIATLQLAEEFLNLAPPVCPDRAVQSFAGYYVLGHSFELSMKAVLIEAGTTDGELRQLGHQLDRILQAFPQELMDTLPGALGGIIGLLSPLYAAKGLEYVLTGFAHLPDYGQSLEVTRETFSVIKDRVDAAVRTRLAAEKEKVSDDPA